jgi:hypothetical protein
MKDYPAGSGKSFHFMNDTIDKAKELGYKVNKLYPVIEVMPDGKPDWYEGSYCLFFIYSKYKGNFIIKGYRREVEKYLKENYTHYFYYVSMWHNGKPRGHWKFWKEVTIFEPSKLYKSWKYRFVKYNRNDGKREIELSFKRMPKRWIPEFNELN